MRIITVLACLIIIALPAVAENTIFEWDLSGSEPFMDSANSGYKLYGRHESKAAFDSGDVLGTVGKGVNTITIPQPGLGNWIFAATAFSLSDESAYSNEVEKEFLLQPPTTFRFTVTAKVEIEADPETVDTIKLILAESLDLKKAGKIEADSR